MPIRAVPSALPTLDIAYELQDIRAKNRIFNFYVGESVGRKSSEVSIFKMINGLNGYMCSIGAVDRINEKVIF